MFFVIFNFYFVLKDLLLLVINVRIIFKIGNFRLCIKKDIRERFVLKCLMDGFRVYIEIKLYRFCSDYFNIVRVFDVYVNDVLFFGDFYFK